MPKKTKKEEYAICMERGHTPSGDMKTTDDGTPPYNICKFCGTAYRQELVASEDPTTKP